MDTLNTIQVRSYNGFANPLDIPGVRDGIIIGVVVLGTLAGFFWFTTRRK